MPENPSIQDGAIPLERANERNGNLVRRATWTAAFVGGVVLCALITANLWLILAHLDLSARYDHAHLFWTLCHDGSTPAKRSDTFLQLVAAGNTEWRSARLTKLQLHSADLENVDLRYADFSETDLSDARLTGSRLNGSRFQLARLTGADLQQADLAETQFLKADLSGTKLRAAKLIAASLEQANLKGADLVLADLSDAYLLMTDFSNANLTGANLSGANLESAVLRAADLSLTRLNGANLQEANLSDSNWWRARGLLSDQIADLQKRFPPSEKADASRQNDFALWSKALK